MAKQYEIVIGLEVHVELATKTKIFCGCSTQFGGAPNTHTCPVCTGMPGSLPVLNRQVVEYAMGIGLATHCDITRVCKFDRKNYFYPDNPQNYQISQLYLPIARNGYVEIEVGDTKKKIRIHEMHMGEDAGKLIHDEWDDTSLVDYNRSGVPLVEIVSEPDMRSSEEVIAYLEKLRTTIQYLGASDCKLQEGSMRADVNLSVREMGTSEFGTRTEMKNLNSFKAIARAIEGERERQIELLEEGIHSKKTTIGPMLLRANDGKIISEDARKTAQLMCNGAIEARVLGLSSPAMSITGSGAHGIIATMPLFAYYEVNYEVIDDDILLRATALSYLITMYIKEYSGRLSAFCGCGIAAGTGMACGLGYLRGASEAQQTMIIQNMASGLTGMICDGGNQGCAMKGMVAVDAAFRSVDMAMQNVCIDAIHGINGRTPEDTMRNMGRIASPGMVKTEEVIVDIMKNK